MPNPPPKPAFDKPMNSTATEANSQEGIVTESVFKISRVVVQRWQESSQINSLKQVLVNSHKTGNVLGLHMNNPTDLHTSRRDFIKVTGKIATVSALAGVVLPHVHAAGNELIQVALIGCGGRGTGAASNALSTKSGPIKLVAMGDVFPDRLKASHDALKREHGTKVDVAEDKRFVGFDAYKKAMDCLKPGDVVIFATPVGFRWVHFAYAIEKKLNVFMEKPITTDGPTTRKMFKLAEESEKAGLKVGVGLMVRHCRARQALHERIQQGEIGDLILLRAYRMAGPMVGFAPPNPGVITDLMYQIQKFHSFLWASGGTFSDFYIHQIDECSWMKNAWPKQAQAVGGRHFRGEAIDQNFDSYQVEYTYGDGSKLMMYGRNVAGCNDEFASYAHGSKGSAIVSTSGHAPGKCRIFKGQSQDPKDVTWKYPQPESDPYQNEWDDLVDAIRNNKPFNEAKRGAEASLVTSMGRMAAHTGQVITWDGILNHEHEFAPTIDKLTMASAPPVTMGPDGKYPVPAPGMKHMREY